MTRVFADSPAYHAGVQVGDILMKADGQDLTDLPSDDVADLVRGEAGTQVELEAVSYTHLSAAGCRDRLVKAGRGHDAGG